MVTPSNTVSSKQWHLAINHPPVHNTDDELHTDFASTVAIPPELQYVVRNRRGGGTGSVTTNKELRLQVVDFFEYATSSTAGTVAQSVSNYYWDAYQNLFDNNPSGIITPGVNPFCRVRKVHVWVLPTVGISTQEQINNSDRVYTVNCQVPATVTGTSPITAVATNTQVTNVLPQVDTFWKKVLSVDLNQTFKSGVYRPYFAAGASASSAQCLFQMEVVEPDDGRVFMGQDSPLTIKVKVMLEVDQPVLPIQTAKLSVFRNETFAQPSLVEDGDPYQVPSDSYVQMQIRGAMDAMR